MNNKTILQLTIGLFFLGIAGINSNVHAAIYYGETNELSGDVQPVGEGSGDLVFSSISVDSSTFTFKTRFAPGTFSSANVGFTVILDIDQNPATGSPGSDSGGFNDNGIIGVDFLASYEPAINSATVFQYAGAVNSFTLINSTSVISFFPDGADVTLPRTWFGNDEGLLNFKVTSAKLITTNGYTGVLDYMPNLGLPAAQTSAVPIPGSAWLLGSGIAGLIGIRRNGKK